MAPSRRADEREGCQASEQHCIALLIASQVLVASECVEHGEYGAPLDLDRSE